MRTQRLQFDENLKELQAAIVQMGEKVDQAIELSVEALQTGDIQLAKRIVDEDVEINAMEEKIDNIGTRLIATQQPVARDLRRILIAFKISSDLERMGDLAVDIATTVIRLGENGLIKPIDDIMRMAELSRRMTTESIEAYTHENMDLAHSMAKLDDEVDQLHGRNMQELFGRMSADPSNLNKALLLAFISRYLERIADHATNIGESVVYLIQGKRPDLNQ